MRPIYLISKTPHEGVIHIPILTISFLNPPIDFTHYEGIVFTSKQAILTLENYLLDWNKLKCICVSEGTASCARDAGALDIEVGNGYGTSIPSVLKAKKRQGKWLYLRPKVVASEWVDVARNEGFHIDEAIVYETTCNEEARNYTIDKDAILVFTSPSSIECFCASYPILPTYNIVAIGKTTRAAFKNAKEVHLSPQTSVASAIELARKIAQDTSAF